MRGTHVTIMGSIQFINVRKNVGLMSSGYCTDQQHKAMATSEASAESIPTHATACSARFQELVDGSASLNGKIQGLDEKIEDERDRFEMFIKNSGAARTGRSSLQYRLLEASGMRTRFVGFLQTLARVLDVGKLASFFKFAKQAVMTVAKPSMLQQKCRAVRPSPSFPMISKRWGVLYPTLQGS